MIPLAAPEQTTKVVTQVTLEDFNYNYQLPEVVMRFSRAGADGEVIEIVDKLVPVDLFVNDLVNFLTGLPSEAVPDRASFETFCALEAGLVTMSDLGA